MHLLLILRDGISHVSPACEEVPCQGLLCKGPTCLTIELELKTYLQVLKPQSRPLGCHHSHLC